MIAVPVRVVGAASPAVGTDQQIFGIEFHGLVELGRPILHEPIEVEPESVRSEADRQLVLLAGHNRTFR